MKQTCFISGKVTGLPFTEVIKNFKEASDIVEKMGMKPINPLDHTNENMSWEECMEILLPIVEKSDNLFLLKNYLDSIGSRQEYSKFIECQESRSVKGCIIKQL